MATPGDAEKPEILKDNIMSNRLEDILQCSNILRQRVVVTSATYPYHVEWTNSEWSKACGWQSDEILGIKFMSVVISLYSLRYLLHAVLYILSKHNNMKNAILARA